MTEENKKIMGDFFREIIASMELNLMLLEAARKRHGRILKFVLGINRNIRKRKMQISHYQNILKRYIKQGWAV